MQDGTVKLPESQSFTKPSKMTHYSMSRNSLAGASRAHISRPPLPRRRRTCIALTSQPCDQLSPTCHACLAHDLGLSIELRREHATRNCKGTSKYILCSARIFVSSNPPARAHPAIRYRWSFGENFSRPAVHHDSHRTLQQVKLVILMKQKSDGQSCIYEAITCIVEHFEKSITRVRVVNANQLFTKAATAVCDHLCIHINPMVAHTVTENDIAEHLDGLSTSHLCNSTTQVRQVQASEPDRHDGEDQFMYTTYDC